MWSEILGDNCSKQRIKNYWVTVVYYWAFGGITKGYWAWAGHLSNVESGTWLC